MLFGDNIQKRDKWFKFFAENPLFRMQNQGTIDEQRVLAFDRIKAISDAKLFSIYDFKNDPVNLFTCHEMIG
jgi:acyl-CoA oxidase